MKRIRIIFYVGLIFSHLFSNSSIAETSGYVRLSLPQCISIEFPNNWMVISSGNRTLIDTFLQTQGLKAVDSKLGFLAEYYDDNEQRLGSANVRYYPDAPITQKQVRTFSTSDIATFDTYNRKGADLAIGGGGGGKVSNWVNAQLDTVNGILGIKFGYDRFSPLFGEGVFHVDIFRVYDGPRSFSLTTSYLKSSAQKIEPLINHIKQSLKQECVKTDIAPSSIISGKESTYRAVDLSNYDLETTPSPGSKDYFNFGVSSHTNQWAWQPIIVALGILLILPVIIRIVWRKSLSKNASIAACVLLWLPYYIAFANMDIGQYSHLIPIGVFINYFILRFQTEAGAKKYTDKMRQELGYDTESSEYSHEQSINWWGSKSKEFRLWGFYSVVWVLAVLVYIIAFDPYGRMYGDDYFHMIFIMLSPPLFVGIAKLVYNRWIK